MRTIEIKIYKIEDHPNKEKCFEWIRNNWHDLNEHSVSEIIKSIEALSSEIGGTFNYSICPVPYRGEHITFKDYSIEALNSLKAQDCPLTGTCWDIDVIEGLIKNDGGSQVLKALHDDTEYQYSTEGLQSLCEANEYEFTESGELYW